MARIIGFVVSTPGGDYDENKVLPRGKAVAEVRSRNARLSQDERCNQGSWEYGAVYDTGETSFEYC